MPNRLAHASLSLLAACSAAQPARSPDAPPAPPPATASAPAPPAPPAAATPEAIGLAIVDGIAHGRNDEVVKRFDAGMASAMPPATIANVWRALEDASGPFERVEGAETDVEEGYRVVRVTCRFAHLRKVVRVVLGADDRVAGLFFGPVVAEIEDSARALIDKIVHGDFDGVVASFDAVMKASLPADKLRAVWKQIEKRTGPIVEVTRTTVVPPSAVLVTCRDTRAELVVRVVFDLRGDVAALFFVPGESLAPWSPPPYVHTDRFVERSVTLSGSPALPGTLTLPKTAPPSPAVVLVHGSGPNDADESIGGSRIFKDLAWGLASRGIAVLRYTKRTRAVPASVATVREEVLDGAAAAIDLAANTSEIDPKRIVVVGHSQGGYLAPRIASQSPSVAAIVLLAGPSRPLEDSLVDQFVYLAGLDPGNAAKKKLIAAARAFKVRVEDPSLKPDENVELPGGSLEKGSYFLSLRGYQPVSEAAQLSIPILVLQGDRDYQVTTPDFDGWKRALGGRANVATKRYAGLNHLFIAGTGRPGPSEYELPGHIDVAVVADIAAFVDKLPPSTKP